MSHTIPTKPDQLGNQLIQLAPFGVIVCDESGIVQLTNAKAENLLGPDCASMLKNVSGSDCHLEALLPGIAMDEERQYPARQLLPANGERQSLEVRHEKLDADGRCWNVFYLAEPVKRRDRELLLEKEASTDELSGLANRRAFQKTMEANQRKALSLSLIHI